MEERQSIPKGYGRLKDGHIVRLSSEKGEIVPHPHHVHCPECDKERAKGMFNSKLRN